MSNTWDTVFEEGFSSVPVCNNCLIICLLVLQALHCHFVCHVPVFSVNLNIVAFILLFIFVMYSTS
jgi:hypothetical protein